jgi:thioredoxin reductase
LNNPYDVIIAGGGPAGLSAALVLGRCRRRVLICDTGKPRNAASHGLHCYLTRDNILPFDFLELGRQELAPYAVEFRGVEVAEAALISGGFEISLSTKEKLHCRKFLIATGVVDELPEITGIQQFYGQSVFHCPYCDGWEVKDSKVVVYGNGKAAYSEAIVMRNWTSQITVCTDGPARLNAEQSKKLRNQNISVKTQKIERLVREKGKLHSMILKDGTEIPCDAIFFSTGQHQRSKLARSLGCSFNRRGAVKKNKLQATNVPGLYVAGDASEDVQFAIVAAAEGAKAAYAINSALIQEDFGLT